MVARRELLVATQNREVAQTATDAIHTSAGFTLRTVCELDELAGELTRTDPGAALVDIAPHPDTILNELKAHVQRCPETRFVVVADEMKLDWVVRAMEAGARHFMTRDTLRSDLADVLERITPEGRPGNDGPSQMVTVLSAGGGCGGTTVAVNLADELARALTQPVLLVDMDEAFGGAGAHLGINAEYSLADVLADDQRLDEQLIRSTAVEYNERLHLLVSPATVSLTQPQPLQLSNLRDAVRAMQIAYGYTVIDAPRIPFVHALDLADASVLTLLIFEMNVADIRIARSMIRYLIEHGLSPQRLMPVANRRRPKKEMVLLAEAQSALKVDRIECLPNDYRNVLSSINFGKTLADVASRSALRREIRDLAETILSQSPNLVTSNGMS